MRPAPFIIGQTIDLRPLQDSDVDGNYVNWFNDAEVCQYNGHHVYPYTRAAALSYIGATQNSKTDLVLAIVTKGETAVHIGNISLQNINFVNRSAEFAIILGEKPYWGQGIAKEAASLIIRHGFAALNLHRIYCGTSAKNVAMQKLALALEMREEGRRRQALYKDGGYADIIEYGLLRQDYKLAADSQPYG